MQSKIKCVSESGIAIEMRIYIGVEMTKLLPFNQNGNFTELSLC